jgi:hypothetical protein
MKEGLGYRAIFGAVLHARVAHRMTQGNPGLNLGRDRLLLSKPADTDTERFRFSSYFPIMSGRGLRA